MFSNLESQIGDYQSWNFSKTGGNWKIHTINGKEIQRSIILLSGFKTFYEKTEDHQITIK